MTTTETLYCSAWACVLLLIAWLILDGTLLK